MENDETMTDGEIAALSPAVEDDRITFTFKKTHLFAALLPVAFLAGLLAGWAAWGRQPAAPVQAASPQTTGQQQVTAPQDVRRYDIPIDANDPSYGPEDAPVTIIEFSDFECPYCRRHALEVQSRLLQAYGDQIRLVYKDFPLSSIHANAIPAAEAAQCAQEQGQFWGFHDLLFGMQLGLSPEAYQQYASSLGLDMDEFDQCVSERRYADDVQGDYNFAASLGVRSTPTFFINGIAIVGAQPFEVFAQVIDAELSGE
jgi:protein-disulfide isomerase